MTIHGWKCKRVQNKLYDEPEVLFLTFETPQEDHKIHLVAVLHHQLSLISHDLYNQQHESFNIYNSTTTGPTPSANEHHVT